jgi:hypothetical protein
MDIIFDHIYHHIFCIGYIYIQIYTLYIYLIFTM